MMTVELVREPRRGGCDFCGAETDGRIRFTHKDIGEVVMIIGRIKCESCGAEVRYAARYDGKQETKQALENKLIAAWTEGRPVKIMVARETTKGE